MTYCHVDFDPNEKVIVYDPRTRKPILEGMYKHTTIGGKIRIKRGDKIYDFNKDEYCFLGPNSLNHMEDPWFL